MQVRWTLVLIVSFCCWACTKENSQPKVLTPFQKSVAEYPKYKEQCNRLKTEYEAQCGDKFANGQCILKDEESFIKTLQLISDSPMLDEKYDHLVDDFFTKELVSKEEIGDYIALGGRDCWSIVHHRAWRSLFNSLNDKKHINLVRDHLRKRIVSPPFQSKTMLGILLRISTLKGAVESQVFGVKKDLAINKLDEMKNDIKKEIAPITAEFNALTAGQNKSNLGALGEDESSFPEDYDFDPIKFRNLMKKELSLFETYRKKLDSWIVESRLNVEDLN